MILKQLLERLIDIVERWNDKVVVRIATRNEHEQVTHYKEVEVSYLKFTEGNVAIAVEQVDLDKASIIPNTIGIGFTR